jgi:hypothetical protein
MQQSGGQNPFQTIFMNLDTPYKLLYGAILVLIIGFSGIIPPDYRDFLDSTLGRILSVAAVYGVVHYMGWIYGLLTTLAILLIINGSSRIEYTEGFNGGGTINEKKTVGKRWFVERVLNEEPKRIETDKVRTTAIEGITSGSMMN